MKFTKGEWKMRNGQKATITGFDGDSIVGYREKESMRWLSDGRFNFLIDYPPLDLISPWEDGTCK